jgi:hypothetical protein
VRRIESLDDRFWRKRSLGCAKLDFAGFHWLDLAETSLDGLEREFKFFNWLEGGVCTMCAPGDQIKSQNSQFERVEVNELQHRRRADVSGEQIKWSPHFMTDVEP